MASLNRVSMDDKEVQTELELLLPVNDNSPTLELQGDRKSSLMKRASSKCSYHLTFMKQKLNSVQSKLEDEQHASSKKELILQAQLDEDPKHIRSQEELNQETEEMKQLKQDLQITGGEASNHLNIKQGENSQNWLIPQTQVNEVPECIKPQEPALSQKTEETEELELDLEWTMEEWKLDPENMILQAQLNLALKQVESQDKELRQAKQMNQDLQRIQRLFILAERELRNEREKTKELKRRNNLLGEENFKLCAELQQVQTQLLQMEEGVHTQVDECEPQHHEIGELQVELACKSTSHQVELECDRLQKKLEKVQLIKETEEKARVIQKLQSNLKMASILSEKDNQTIQAVMDLNERLLDEKRALLYRLSEAEKRTNISSMSAISAQDKFDLNNEHLQDQIQKPSNQGRSLEGAVRSNESDYSLDNTKEVLLPQSPCISPTTGNAVDEVEEV